MDLSAFYIDVTKDRMYTFGAKSEARRSGQTAMYIIVDGLARLLAPVLSVTMDELWRMLPGEREESVHMALFPRELDQWQDAALLERWARAGCRSRSGEPAARGEAQGQDHRRESVGARRASTPTARRRSCCSTIEDFLPTLFGVSEVSSSPKAPPRRRRRGRRVEKADRNQV